MNVGCEIRNCDFFFAGSCSRRREGRDVARFHAALFARQEARGGALRSSPSLVRGGRRSRHVSMIFSVRVRLRYAMNDLSTIVKSVTSNLDGIHRIIDRPLSYHFIS